MLDITPKIPDGKNIIESYGDGGFKVSGEKHQGSIIILPDYIFPWNISSFDEIATDSLEDIISRHDQIDILLIGCGNEFRFMNNAIISELKSHNISVDSMDTGAACRTYNVLLAEERNIAAALIAI